MRLGARVKAELKLTEVFPRGGEAPLVFHAAPMATRARFDELVKPPAAPILERAGVKTVDETDDTYLAQRKVYNELYFAYMALTCLTADGGLVFETVNIDEPGTWTNWTKELTDFGLIDAEIVRLMNLVMRANALSDEYIDAARAEYFRNITVR